MMNNNVSSIVSKLSYFTPSRYISGRIVEYDIKSANITMLKVSNVISEETYQYLQSLPKMSREIEIGLLIRSNPNIFKAISSGIEKYKLKFAEANNIDENRIVRVANDAIYLNTPVDLKYTIFDNIVEFKKKSIYDVAIKINNVIIFSAFQGENMDIDVKGIGNNSQLHQNYMISVIGSVIHMIERSDISEAFKYISEFSVHYLNRELDIGYYREFNAESKFKIINSPFYISNCDECYIDKIDINYNYAIIRVLWSIVTQIYNIRRR